MKKPQDETQKVLGINLSRIRKFNKLSRRELALMSKVSHSEIKLIEGCKTKASERIINALAVALKVSIDTLTSTEAKMNYMGKGDNSEPDLFEMRAHLLHLAKTSDEGTIRELFNYAKEVVAIRNDKGKSSNDSI